MCPPKPISWRWGLGEIIRVRGGHEGWDPMMGLLFSLEETPELSLLPLKTELEARKRTFARGQPCGHSEFGNSASRTVRNRYLSFKPLAMAFCHGGLCRKTLLGYLIFSFSKSTAVCEVTLWSGTKSSVGEHPPTPERTFQNLLLCWAGEEGILRSCVNAGRYLSHKTSLDRRMWRGGEQEV